MKITLFQNETGEVTTEWFQLDRDGRNVYCYGDFGGATVKLQTSPDKNEAFDEAEHTFTVKGKARLYSSPGVWVRGTISGGTNRNITLIVV